MESTNLPGFWLKPEFAFVLATGLIQLGASWAVLRATLARLEHDRDEDRRAWREAREADRRMHLEGVAETQRLLRAVHGRLDTLSSDVKAIELKHARLDERVSMLRDPQRLRRRAAAEARAAGEPPILSDDFDEG